MFDAPHLISAAVKPLIANHALLLCCLQLFVVATALFILHKYSLV